MMKLPAYNMENYEELFTLDDSKFTDSVEEKIEQLRDKQITGYRVKTIRSGPMLECEIYPITGPRKGERSKERKGSRLVQTKLNNKNAEKTLIRLVNRNFTKDDMWLTFTYDDTALPADIEQSKKDMQNYIRRLKRHIKKHGLDELKYIYVTEYRDASTKKKKRVHHHMICNFPDRDIAEELWNNGGRTQSRRLQPDDFGLEGLARYIAKDKGETTIKRYTPSRNLKPPIVSVANSKVTRRKAEKIATDPNIANELFEKLYNGYKFNDMHVKYSPYVAGAYIYVRMRRVPIPITKKGRKNN